VVAFTWVFNTHTHTHKEAVYFSLHLNKKGFLSLGFSTQKRAVQFSSFGVLFMTGMGGGGRGRGRRKI
jgi:hypothetical protein